MATQFLSRAELDRLDSFPQEIAADQLAAYFRLDGEELPFVREQRGAASQLGIALQLCTLRWLGFVPAGLVDAPADAIDCLTSQLDVPARAIFDYAVRERTGRDHLALARDRLGFCVAGETEIDRLRSWLVEQALERDKPTLLLQRACDELRAWRVERPTLDRLVRLIAWAREHAHERTYELLSPVLTQELRHALDELLIVGAGRSGRTPLSWLRSRPTSLSPRALRRELDKRAYLSERIGPEGLDLEALTPSRRAWLAQLGRRSSNQALARMDPVRRYPVLACFCADMLERSTDDALEVFDRAIGRLDRGAQREQQDLRRRHGRQTEATVRRFIEIARIVLEAQEAGSDPLRLIDRRVGLKKLKIELQEAEGIVRPPGEDHLDLVLNRGAGERGMLAELVAALTFHADTEPDREVLAALRLVGQLADSKQRWLPGFSPSGFLDRHWRALVVESSRGRLDRRAYELAVAFELRSALRSGRVWVDGSLRHSDPASYLLPQDRWQQIKPQFAKTVDQPLTASARLDALAAEQAELVTALQAMSSETGIEIEAGELQVIGGERENDSSRLSDLIAERLPKLELGELLVEVDGWTGFTKALTHAGGASSRTENLPRVLYAAILAQATNLGLTGMADSSDLSYDQLAWANEWYLRDETLAAASARLVGHHHGLPLASSWGDGRLSSSDGQRFATSAKGPSVAALPRYFGHRRRGAQFFTWTSDQYSQYASKVVAATVRDAAHVLDGILDNQTELEVEEHTTDTHG